MTNSNESVMNQYYVWGRGGGGKVRISVNNNSNQALVMNSVKRCPR